MSTKGESTRERAYRLWKERGCPTGSPEVDWFKAEKMVSSVVDNNDDAFKGLGPAPAPPKPNAYEQALDQSLGAPRVLPAVPKPGR